MRKINNLSTDVACNNVLCNWVQSPVDNQHCSDFTTVNFFQKFLVVVAPFALVVVDFNTFALIIACGFRHLNIIKIKKRLVINYLGHIQCQDPRCRSQCWH